LSDVEHQYDNEVGFESKMECLRNEVNKLNHDQASSRAGFILLPLVGPKLVNLTQNGVTEQDIINIAGIFEKYVDGKDRESFDVEVQKMKMEVNLLQTQNQDLNKDNQSIMSSLTNSRHTVDWLVYSLRNESLGLLECPIRLQFEYLELKTIVEDHEFLSLRRAYKGDKNVSIPEIKK